MSFQVSPEVARIMSIARKAGIEEDMMWAVQQDGTVKSYINCNDLFHWASADAEEIETIEDIDLLEQTLNDLLEIEIPIGKTRDDGSQLSMSPRYHLNILYACRRRKMRPQGPYYAFIDKQESHLFDACGPEREDSPKIKDGKYMAKEYT